MEAFKTRQLWHFYFNKVCSCKYSRVFIMRCFLLVLITHYCESLTIVTHCESLLTHYGGINFLSVCRLVKFLLNAKLIFNNYVTQVKFVKTLHIRI